MADPIPTEAIPKAILYKDQQEIKPATAAIGTPEKAVNENAKRLFEGIQADQAESALEQQAQQITLDKEKSADNREMIGITRNTAGDKDRPSGSAEEARYNQAESNEKITFTFLEKGLEGVATNIGATEKGQLMHAVKNVIDHDDFLSVEFANLRTLPPVAVPGRGNVNPETLYIENLMKDPRFTARVKSKLSAFIENPPQVDDNAYHQQEKLMREAERQEEEEKRKFKQLDKHIKEYKKDSRTGNYEPGSKGAELESLMGREAEINGNVAKYNGEVTVRQMELEKKIKMGATQTDIDAARDAYTAALENHKKAETEQTRLTTLKAERDNLDNKRAERDTQKKIWNEKQDITRQEKGKLSDIKKQREQQEQKIANGYIKAFEEASREFLEENEKKPAIEKLKKQREDQAKEEKDESKKAVKDDMSERYCKKEKGMFGRERLVTQDKLVAEDYKKLVDEGPKALMSDILARKRPPIPQAERQKLLNNTEYMKEMNDLVVENVLSWQILTKGITPQEATYISKTEWGKDVIDKAVSTFKADKERMKQLESEGALIHGKGFMERYWHHLKQRKGSWALGIIGALIVAGYIVNTEGPAGEMEMR